jgi:hypothetical protein
MKLQAHAPIAQPNPERQPLLREVSVTGLDIERVFVSSSFFAGAGSSSAAAACSGSACAAAAASSGMSVAANKYEHYTDHSANEFLKLLLEDNHLVGKIVSGAPVEIRGVFMGTTDTTGAYYLWNVMTGLTLTAFAGVPNYIARESRVELRIYRDNTFVRSYLGEGGCDATGSVYSIGAHKADGELEACSLGNAIQNAVLQMQRSPPNPVP